MERELLYTRIAGHFFNRPIALRPQEAEIIGSFLRSRMEGAAPTPEASRFVGEDQRDPSTGRWKGYRVEGGIGVVTILGELVNRGAWLGASSGLTSYEGIAQQIRAAAADDKVKSIVLDIQSPGGEAVGMNETSRFIRQVSKSKPVVAVVNGMAASAAYGLASGAGEIVVTESAITGSIGVVLVHFDQSRRLEDMGVKATLIHAGNLKVVGNQFGPLSVQDRAVLQAEVDRFMTGFVDLVADQRQISAEKIRSFEAGIFIGADAVAAGLADRVGTVETVLSDLTRAKGRSTMVQKGASRMDNTQGVPAANEDAGIPKATHDAAIKQAKADGHAAGFEEGRAIGAKDAHGRFTAVLESDGIKGDAKRMAAALTLAAKAPGMTAADVAAYTADTVPAAGAEPVKPGKPEGSLDRRSEKPDSLGQAGIGADTKTRERFSAASVYEQRRKQNAA